MEGTSGTPTLLWLQQEEKGGGRRMRWTEESSRVQYYQPTMGLKKKEEKMARKFLCFQLLVWKSLKEQGRLGARKAM